MCAGAINTPVAPPPNGLGGWLTGTNCANSDETAGLSMISNEFALIQIVPTSVGIREYCKPNEFQ